MRAELETVVQLNKLNEWTFWVLIALHGCGAIDGTGGTCYCKKSSFWRLA